MGSTANRNFIKAGSQDLKNIKLTCHITARKEMAKMVESIAQVWERCSKCLLFCSFLFLPTLHELKHITFLYISTMNKSLK
jgi:hypothetical protein